MGNREHEEHFASGALLPWRHIPDLGWGFIVAWGISIIFTNVFTQGDAANLGWFWLASMIGAPVGLLVFFFVKDILRNSKVVDLLQLFALAGMVLGTTLLELSLWIDLAYATGIQVLAGVMSSLGTAVFTVLWGSYYTTLDMQRIERSVVYSLVLAFACYAFVLIVPNITGVIIVACLPFLSAFCFKAASGHTGETDIEVTTPETSVASKLNVKGFTRLGLGVVGTTTVISLFWSLVNNGTIPLEHNFFEVSVLSGTAVAVLLMVYMTRYSRTLNLGTLYRWILPLIAIAFSLLFFSGDVPIMLATLLVFAAQALLNLLTFVYFAELSKRTGMPASRVFGYGRFFQEFGFLLGILIAPTATWLTGYTDSYQGVLIIALTGLIVLVMSSIAIQDRLAFTLKDEESASQATSADATLEPRPADAFEAVCDQIAARYALTKREREILSYLAQGYSLPYVRNELYISQSTIDTHVGHIYRKMNIHSREELITQTRAMLRSDE